MKKAIEFYINKYENCPFCNKELTIDNKEDRIYRFCKVCKSNNLLKFAMIEGCAKFAGFVIGIIEESLSIQLFLVPKDYISLTINDYSKNTDNVEAVKTKNPYIMNYILSGNIKERIDRIRLLK